MSLLALFYIWVLILLINGLSKLRPGINHEQPYVSVVIAARNEEKDLPDCLESLLAQKYPRDKYEVIIVNDRSGDRTGTIIEHYSKHNTHYHYITISESNTDMAPKKWALHKGIQKATGDIILTTDADCIVKPGWIEKIVCYFDADVGLVAGFSPLIRCRKSSLFQKLLALDSLALAGVSAGSFGADFPLTCNGRNLAYRKSVYLEVGGFNSIGRFISGDDDLLMHKIKEDTTWKMRYAVDTQSIVETVPPVTLYEFYSQRTRHASKGFHYNNWMVCSLIGVYVFNLLLLVSLLFQQLWPLFLPFFIIKSTFEFILVWKTACLFQLQKIVKLFPIGIMVHFIYVILFGFLGQVKKINWKDEG